MRKNSCPSGLLLLVAIVSNAPVQVSAATGETPGPVSEAWAVRINPPPNSYLHVASMDVGPSGDVFLVGNTRSSDFGNYDPDILITRRSPSGALVWEKRYESSGSPSENEMAVGLVATGSAIYVVGSISSLTGSLGPDFLTLKYRDTGELEWAARYDDPGHLNNMAAAVTVDGLGNVLVAGDSISTNGTVDILVLKYGPAGNLLWTFAYDSPDQGHDRVVGIRTDSAGNIYVAGTSTQSSEVYSVATFKLGPDGHQLWTARETSGNPQGVTARSLDVDAAGNVAVLGVERSYSVTWNYDALGNRRWKSHYRAEEPASMYAVKIQFDASGDIISAANLYGSGVNDAVLVKYAAADGRQIWATRVADPTGTAHLNALGVDGDGNSYLTVSPASDVVTVKVSPGGAQLWKATFNSQGFYSDYGEFLKVDAAGDVFVAGRSTQFADAFVSLVKYTQQPLGGGATAVVTPALQVVDPGTNVVFTAAASGPGPIYFQWRLNGRPIPGATNATLELANVQASHRGDYSVIISNPAGATVSPESRLSVRTPPEVAIAPTETVAYVGSDAAFLATVAGNDFATLQWRHNGANIPGATNEIFRIPALNEADGGAYDIVVSTFGGTTTSSAAGLRISSAVRLVGTTPNRSSGSTWDYAPQLQVLPTGEFLIAARSNHVMGSSIVLHKHAADGGLAWTSVFESSEFTNAEPSRVALDGAGNIYVTGLSRQPYLPAAWAVLKFNPNGQLLWSRFLTGTNLWGSAHVFAVDAQGRSTIGVLNTPETSVTRYDSDGAVLWSHVDLSPDNDTIALAVDASGNAYLGTTIRLDNGRDSEIRLRKFDPTGMTVWTIPYAEGRYNRLAALAVDAAGHLIVTGTGELSEVPNSWMFVQKYSPGGEKLWETRTGRSWSELSYIRAMAVGPGDEITVATMSDDDYELGEQAGVIRIGAGGQLKYRVAEPQVILSGTSQLTLDDFGNAYITGYGSRAASGVDAVTAKYDAYGNRPWLIYDNGSESSWQYALAVGADAAGDIRVLTTVDFGSEAGADFAVLHYRQRDPASTFRLQMISDAGGTFHLGTPAVEPFRIEASTDLQSWSALTDEETQRLLQPGATTFSGSSRRFFRLALME